MKKVALSLLAGAFFIASCGPSAEEQAKEQQRIADSAVAAEQARIQDSLAQAEKMAQEALALEAQRVADSTRQAFVADSIAKASKKPAAPKPKKTQEQIIKDKLDKEVKDATRGRG